MGHELHDSISLEISRQVAARLRESPAVLDVARANLDRWSRRNADVPGLLRCYEEWRKILDQPASEICELLGSESEEAQRLRQNSPFAGVLTPAEVWSIKSRVRQHHAQSAA